MNNPLKDLEFLKQLDYYHNKEKFIRITALSMDEIPRESIEGKATGGNVNIDGNSAIRRTCSLSLTVDPTDTIITDEYWAYSNKFKLEIGLKNTINNKYPDIIWFKQGIYGITSFTCARNLNSLTISISGKDKMCFLNGELGGKLPAEINFGVIDKIDEEGNLHSEQLPLYTIIREAMQLYGKEPLSNILIQDLDIKGYELWEYRGNDPMYIILNKDLTIFNILLNNDLIVYTENNKDGINIDEIDQFYQFSALAEDFNINATEISLEQPNNENSWNELLKYYVAKIEYGETAGYHQVPLTYNGDLILNVGSTIVNLLDKIKNMLGEYEYYYDIDGRFVFQRKQTFTKELLATNFTPNIPLSMFSEYSYKFMDWELFSGINETPVVNNLKNDYSVWGQKKSATGANIPIHTRYALDTKPIFYKSLERTNKKGEQFPSITYITSDQPEIANAVVCDWREIIYQMATDYMALNHNPQEYYNVESNYNYQLHLRNNNPIYSNGHTGYEQYYSDILGFWRYLYDPTIDNQIKTSQDLIEKYEKELMSLEDENKKVLIEEDLAEEKNHLLELQQKREGYYTENELNGKYTHWNKSIHLAPESLIFWFDFLDMTSELFNYSVQKIGDRAETVNQTTVQTIYNEGTPEILFVYPDEEVDAMTSRIQINVSQEFGKLFELSSRSASAIDKTNELIYKHLGLANSLSITATPIYYLQPNTRIFILDKGDYILNKISYSLTYNATMSLSCSKIVKQFVKEVM